MLQLTDRELDQDYQDMTSFFRCQCTLATELVGGLPADDMALEQFVIHHLKVPQEEVAAAVARIKAEEVSKDLRPPEGELEEKRVYGVNVIRRDAHGPYLGDWMIKACIKAAASRLNIFTEVRGSKGNFAEAGRVNAIGFSLHGNPRLVYLNNEEGTGPAETYFQEFSGSVLSPQGRTSIIHHSECVKPGSRFAFEFRFIGRKLRETDIIAVVSLIRIIGLGSVKALERGKFTVDKCEIDLRGDSHAPRG